MDRNLIIIPGPVSEISPSRLLKLREAALRLDLRYVERKSITAPLLKDCEAIYGCPPPELLKDAPNLRWHHLPYAGAEPYDDLTLYANKSVTLTNSSGVYGGVIAEHVLGMVLALLRQRCPRLRDCAPAR